MKKTHFALAVAGATTAAVVLTACSSESSKGPSSSGSSSGSAAVSNKNLVIGANAEPSMPPDPVMENSLAGLNYYYNEFDELAITDATGAIVPGLATKFTSSPDFTTWTFTIRNGVTFSDGSPLTAKDVVFTYQTVQKAKASDNNYLLTDLTSVTAPDDTTVVFTLGHPYSAWPSSTTNIPIVPQAAYTSLGSAGFAKAPVGSGQYKFVSYTKGVSYVMERNPSYWGKPGPFAKVTFQTVADDNARFNGVESGSLDLALIAANQAGSVQSPAKEVGNPSNGVTFLGLNSSTGPLANVKLRQAISVAIELTALTKSVLAGRATPNSQLAAPGVAGYDESFANATYDPDAAKALVAASGYDGSAIPFEYATNGRIPLSTDIVQAIQGMLSAVGIKVQLIGMDQATLSSRIYGQVNMKGIYLNTWAPSNMDGDSPTTNLFSGGANDYAKSADTAALVAKERTVSGASRAAVFQELWKLNVDQAFIIALYTPETDYAINKNISWTPRADGEFVIAEMSSK